MLAGGGCIAAPSHLLVGQRWYLLPTQPSALPTLCPRPCAPWRLGVLLAHRRRKSVYYLAFLDVSSPGFCHGHGARLMGHMPWAPAQGPHPKIARSQGAILGAHAQCPMPTARSQTGHVKECQMVHFFLLVHAYMLLACMHACVHMHAYACICNGSGGSGVCVCVGSVGRMCTIWHSLMCPVRDFAMGMGHAPWATRHGPQPKGHGP